MTGSIVNLPDGKTERVTLYFLCRFWPQLGSVEKNPAVQIGSSEEHPLSIDLDSDLFQRYSTSFTGNRILNHGRPNGLPCNSCKKS